MTEPSWAESLAREFAAKYNTPAVQEAIRHAEGGRLTWLDIADLFRRSHAEAVEVIEEKRKES